MLVLVVDDERNFRETLAELVESEGFTSQQTASGAETLDGLADGSVRPDVILLDIRMPGADGLAVLREIRDRELSDAPVIMVSAYGDSSRTIEAMRLGAYDYVTKPIDVDELTAALRRAGEQRRASLSLADQPLADATENSEPGAIIGTSRPIRDVLKRVGRIAASDATTLITGESGTGKELVARAIHEHSARARQPFVTVNCGAIAETLLLAELFGHERGAFTGADRLRKGRFEAAHKGTLFLDEVAELSAAAQVALLRVLQERRLERVGGTETVAVDVRVVAATNRDLQELVAQGQFREDLLYRLNVVSVELPALRDRLGDLPLLADHIVQRACERHGTGPKTIPESTLRPLFGYDFPGNVRELQNMIERAVVSSVGSVIGPQDLWPAERPVDFTDRDRLMTLFDLPFNDAVAALERELIRRALEASSGNRTEAARRLRINRRLLYSKMHEHGLG